MAGLGEATTRGSETGYWRPVLLIVVVLAVAMALPLLFLAGTSDDRAAEISADYAAVLEELDGDIAAVDAAAATLTDPAADETQFAAVLPALADLDAHAAAALETTSQTGPRPWPLASAEPVDALSPLRDSLIAAAVASGEIVDDLVGVLNYRAAYAKLLSVGELPMQPPLRFDLFVARLEEMAEEELRLLDELPHPQLFRSHRAHVSQVVRGLRRWVEDYTDAMWVGDEETVQRLLRDLALERLELDRELRDRLGEVRQEIAGELGELSQAIDLARTMLDP